MLDRKEAMRQSVSSGMASDVVAMRLLILSPTVAFDGLEEREFEIIERISQFFGVSIRSVHACGSAKLGFSPRRGSEFVFGESDFDVSIIDPDCFTWYVGEVIRETRQYQDRSSFESTARYKSFVEYLAKGMFRPDFMPNIPAKMKWMQFFDEISRLNQDLFQKVTATIYLSDSAFGIKQAKSIDDFVQGVV